MKYLVFITFSFFIFINGVTGQQVNDQFFNQANAFFFEHVKNGLVNYTELKDNADLAQLIQQVENADLSNLDQNTKKAFLINAYNLQVIQQATDLYPTQSVQSTGGFFDKKKIRVAGNEYTLNKMEKEFLLRPYNDPRLHFVLVCGALGCPPITSFAYHPSRLDRQITEQTKLALNDPIFLKESENKIELSQIFKWYAADFGGNKKAILKFINQYRKFKIEENSKVTYYDYDWTINDQNIQNSTNSEGVKLGNNSSRYIVSSTIPKGSVEIKVFNNLYTQRSGSKEELVDRATFFTSSLSVLYGVNDRFNAGIVTRYRRVRNDNLPSSALSVFSSGDEASSRHGFTAFGAQIRYAPFKALKNFSVQSSFVLPIGNDLAGSETQPYIDWTGATWTTQLFNDFSIGDNFSFFTELDFILEDIGSSENNHLNRFSTPTTFIFSYNPNAKTTIYALGGFSPFWQSKFDYFVQGGAGVKYQFTKNVEIELLYTGFRTKFLLETGGNAATYNVGFRYNL